jgi:electron transfer flavoprotein alpha subunit
MPTSNVLIVAEANEDGLRPVSLELVNAGRQLADQLGGEVIALLIGSGLADAARDLAAAGPDTVLTADDPRLASFTTAPCTSILSQVVAERSPAVILFPGTTSGRDVAPRFAARSRAGSAADAIGLRIEDGALIATRSILGGRLLTDVSLSGEGPRIVTVRPGAFEKSAAGSGAGKIESLPVALDEDDLRVTVMGMEEEEGGAGAVKLEEATVIVSGGRGLKEPENFALVEELAGALRAAVGASRAVVDAGWRPHHEQVGQTGRTVSPKLYIAIGISGAVQHAVGMQGSDHVVAINRDPDAPILKMASFGIVGDLFEVVPAITAEIKAARG